MTTWTDLPNAAVQPGGRPRGSTITALRDNPIAIAEDATGAPKIKRKHMLSSVATSPNTFLNLGEYSAIDFDFMFANTSGISQNFQIQYTTNGGTTWSTAQTLQTVLAGISVIGSGYFDFATGELGYLNSVAGARVLVTVTGATLAIDGVRFINTSTGAIVFLVRPNGGVI